MAAPLKELTMPNVEPTKPAYKLKRIGTVCCIVGCNNRSGSDKVAGEKRSYYRFPMAGKLRKLWMNAIPRDMWTPNKTTRICSDHFFEGRRTYEEGSPGYIPRLFPTSRKVKERSTWASQKAGLQSEIPNVPTERRKVRPVATGPIFTPCIGDHGYASHATPADENRDPEVQTLLTEIEELRAENARQESSLGRLLTLDNVKDNPYMFQQQTNLPNYGVFKAVASFLHDRCNGELRIWRGGATAKHAHYATQPGAKPRAFKPGRERRLSFEEDFFMVLVLLKSGRFNFDVAREFGVSDTYVSRVFTSWVNFLSIECRELFEMKSSDESVAPCYQEYNGLRLVIDCTELIAQRCSNLQARKETFSNYKSRDTFKFLVGLSPNMTVNYISKAYGGRASDKHITLDSEALINQLPFGSKVMADRGFLVSKEFKDMGVELILPKFKGTGRSQMTAAECAASEHIANSRVHIERIIQRIRTFHYLDSTIKLAQKDVVEQIFTVCGYLTNFQAPIIAENKPAPPVEIDQNQFSVIDMLEM